MGSLWVIIGICVWVFTVWYGQNCSIKAEQYDMLPPAMHADKNVD